MPITHAFDDTRPDDGTASLGPDAWNAAHVVEGAYTGTINIGSRTFTVTDGQFVAVVSDVGGSDFPRLETIQYGSASASAFDLVVANTNAWDSDDVSAYHAANPDGVVLIYLPTYSVNWNRVLGYDSWTNVELRTASSDWMLTEVGSTLTSGIDASTLTVPVANGSAFSASDCVLIGGTLASPFTGDSPTNRTTELAVVESVNGNTLTLYTRGTFWPAKSHASGTRIAKTVSVWSSSNPSQGGSIEFDLCSTHCPSVDVGSGAEQFIDWHIRRGQGYVSSMGADGLFFDVYDAGPLMQSYVPALDVDRDNSNDFTDGEDDALRVQWYTGMDALVAGLRTSGPVQVNGPHFCADANGRMMENFPHATTLLSTWNMKVMGIGDNPPVDTSIQYYSDNGDDPNITGLTQIALRAYSGTNGTANFTSADYQFMRYGLTSALMWNCRFNYTYTYTQTAFWFDEYDDAGAGQGWLGQPTGACSKVSTSLTGGVDDVWRRDFTGGIAIVNPNVTGTVTVQLGGTYQKITGRSNYSDTTVNDGTSVTSVTLQARDGIVLKVV